ncbi:MAG: hypothetical protein WC453_04735 [Patescibacteria group bacterium]
MSYWRLKFSRLKPHWPAGWSIQKTWRFAGLGILLALIGILAYLLFALFRISPGELSLAELRDSWEQEKLCHEDCWQRRRAAEAAVVAELKSGPDTSAARRLPTYFLDPAESSDFRIELLSLLRAAYGAANPPDYVRAYLTDPDAAPAIQAAILKNFGSAAVSQPTDGAAANPLDYYFSLLAGGHAVALKLSAAQAISNYPDQAAAFTSGQLTILKKLILNPATDRQLRASLVLLLGDYHAVLASETEKVLRAVYQAGPELDRVSVAFAADLLNRQAGAALALPAVSSEDWDDYYNY